jgi:anti-anti-sigma regulatory factor
VLDVRIDAGQVRLTGQATIYFAEDLKRELARAIAQTQQPLSIDLGGLDALDMAGAQLLVALRRTYGPARVSFTNCPEPILEVLVLSGLEHWLFHPQDMRQGGSWSKTRS